MIIICRIDDESAGTRAACMETTDVTWATPWEAGFEGVVVDGWWISGKRSENNRASMAEVRKTWGSPRNKGIVKTLAVAMERAGAEGKSRENRSSFFFLNTRASKFRQCRIKAHRDRIAA